MTDTDLHDMLIEVAETAAHFRAGGATRPHRPDLTYAQAKARFERALPDAGIPAREAVRELVQLAEGGLANMIGPRFFGWVIGATAPAGLAADWLTSAWGQNAGNATATPAASASEETAAHWLLDLLDLPREASIGFVTGATMANFTCLAAARSEVLRKAGWNVEADGLFGAPEVKVVIGEEAHSTVFSALRYLGLGSSRIVSVPTDEQGRMRPEAFTRAIAKLDGPIIAIAQAGHINSGAFDVFDPIADACAEKGAWLHVDSAFGLWALALPEYEARTRGLRRAHSWAGDGHKWLQTPHDCGYAIVRDSAAHRRAMNIAASYLPADDERHPADFVPELSRRARGFATWVMLRHLGRDGVVNMVRRHCGLARRMAERLAAAADVQILNEVALNQVAVRLGADLDPAKADALTDRTIARIQREGVCFVGGAQWRGCKIVRISVIGSTEAEADIDRSADAILSAWRAERAAG